MKDSESGITSSSFGGEKTLSLASSMSEEVPPVGVFAGGFEYTPWPDTPGFREESREDEDGEDEKVWAGEECPRELEVDGECTVGGGRGG